MLAPQPSSSAADPEPSQSRRDVGFDLGRGPGGCDRNLVADDGPVPQPTAVDNTFRSAGTTVVGIPEFNGFAFEIYDASAAADGTDQFWVALAFADYTTGLVIEPGAGAGSGEATLDDRGDTASMHAAGTFADGATGTIDVECFEVTGG